MTKNKFCTSYFKNIAHGERRIFIRAFRYSVCSVVKILRILRAKQKSDRIYKIDGIFERRYDKMEFRTMSYLKKFEEPK